MAGRKVFTLLWEAGNGRRSKEVRITLSKPQCGAAVKYILQSKLYPT